MEKYVVTFTENLATANGRNLDPSEFIAEMKLRAKVTPYDDEIKAVRAECQEVIDDLTNQLKKYEGQALTALEIRFLNFFRECQAELGEGFQARINELEQNALKTAEDLQKKATLIRELFPEA